MSNPGVDRDVSTNINESRSKRNIIDIVSALCLLVFGIIGVAIKISSEKTNQSIAENVNSVPQASEPSLTIGEKARQIEEKILRGEALNASELEELSPQELRILRNAHFARYGRKFDRPGLGDYFYTRPWYKPIDSFNDGILTLTDRENVKLILSFEKPEITQSAPSNLSTDAEFENAEEEQLSILYSEAQKQAEAFWKKNMTKCGDSY